LGKKKEKRRSIIKIVREEGRRGIKFKENFIAHFDLLASFC
jgi:hypothetical protein